MRALAMLTIAAYIGPDIGLAQPSAPTPRAKPPVSSDSGPLAPDLGDAYPGELGRDYFDDSQKSEAGLAREPKSFAGIRPPIPVAKPDISDAPESVEAENPLAPPVLPPEKPVEAALPRQAKPVFVLAAAKQCEATLRKLGAVFTVADPIEGEGQCGWPRPVKLTGLPGNLKVRGDVRVRCEVALAMARWSKEVVVPSAELHLGKPPEAVRIGTSYQCRRRNNSSAGKLSEHAFANGVDVMGFTFADSNRVNISDRSDGADAKRAFQAAVRGGSCAYFTTVIGPMTNASHADHLHLDLAVRRGGYRLCE